MAIFTFFLNFIAISFGIASAYSWWKSSSVEIIGGFDGGVLGKKSPDEKFVDDFESKNFFEKFFTSIPTPETQFSTLYLSAYYNKKAALCASVAATATALAQLL